MALIKGIHHVALACPDAEAYDRAVAFYTEDLGLKQTLRWVKNGLPGCMLDTGAGNLELSVCGEQRGQGAFPHVALLTADVDGCIAAARKKGLAVTVEPKDIAFASDPPFPARIGFCIGFAGEEIEFFAER